MKGRQGKTVLLTHPIGLNSASTEFSQLCRGTANVTFERREEQKKKKKKKPQAKPRNNPCSRKEESDLGAELRVCSMCETVAVGHIITSLGMGGKGNDFATVVVGNKCLCEIAS